MKSLFAKSKDLQNDYEYFHDFFQSYLGKINKNNPFKEQIDFFFKAKSKYYRPLLLINFAKLFHVKKEKYIYPAMAVELIHSYSLIHDDLPAMDDSEYRRGQKTIHKKFNEYSAILLGDILQSMAFYCLNLQRDGKSLRLQNLILAKAAGMGMCVGQMLDMKNDTNIDKSYMESLKTGALIRASCVVGAILGNVTRKDIRAIDFYAKNLGLAFQIKDNIFDIESNNEIIGKPINNDKTKINSLAQLSKDDINKKLQSHISKAKEILCDNFNNENINAQALENLIILADFTISRNK